MIFSDVVSRGPTPALEKMLAFTEARQRMLSENIANIDNPQYRTKQLDARAFQDSLHKAMETRRTASAGEFRIPASKEVSQDAAGRLLVTPSEEPAENVLFHDDTNTRVERQMSLLAENTLMHRTATELLRNRLDSLMKAIRGKVT